MQAITKQQLKKLIVTKHNEFKKYVDYLKKNYADITKSFERTEALLQKIQEGSEKGQGRGSGASCCSTCGG